MNKYVPGQEVTLSGIFKDEDDKPTWPNTATFKLVNRHGKQTEIAGVKDDSVIGRFYCKHVIQKEEAGGVTIYRGESSEGLVAAGQKKYSVDRDPFS